MPANRILLRFAGDPETYDVIWTIGAVFQFWVGDRITEAKMLVYLYQLKSIIENGLSSVLFMNDVYYDDIVMDTSIWFMEYGVRRPQGDLNFDINDVNVYQH
jgi:hypothetical protein